MRKGFPGSRSPFARSERPSGCGSSTAGKGLSASTPRTSCRPSGSTSGDTMPRMERRDFIKFCAAAAAASGGDAVAADARPRYYQKARLVDENGAALRAGSVPANRNLIFHYPYALGTLGGELFNEFFAKYEFRLATEHGDQAHAAVSGACVVQELEHYCRQQVKC